METPSWVMPVVLIAEGRTSRFERVVRDTLKHGQYVICTDFRYMSALVIPGQRQLVILCDTDGAVPGVVAQSRREELHRHSGLVETASILESDQGEAFVRDGRHTYIMVGSMFEDMHAQRVCDLARRFLEDEYESVA